MYLSRLLHWRFFLFVLKTVVNVLTVRWNVRQAWIATIYSMACNVALPIEANQILIEGTQKKCHSPSAVSATEWPFHWHHRRRTWRSKLAYRRIKCRVLRFSAKYILTSWLRGRVHCLFLKTSRRMLIYERPVSTRRKWRRKSIHYVNNTYRINCNKTSL